ncbi:response regulator transcription factor [Pontibacter ruber]|uniref:Response regulator transcription factor n=1 Tax=Pontibacter ruber TaxID=1343895 RepID=A0ABW5CZA3_9BACT|nr:helix-turn-helix transcriptional regulator [Pontibacter ruber]
MKNVSTNADGSLEQLMQRKIAEIASVSDDLPGVIIIHNLQKQLQVEYISPRGEQQLGFTLEEIQKMGPDYHTRFFNQEDAADYVPKIMNMITRNDTQEIVSFFQQVRASEELPWSWHFSTTKILMQDDDGQPLLTITMAYPIDPLNHVTAKVNRLLDENNFLRKNYYKFSKLSEREQEILRLLALGKSASETADELFISNATVETHRRNIKSKLGTSSFYELTQYARAFDLI